MNGRRRLSGLALAAAIGVGTALLVPIAANAAGGLVSDDFSGPNLDSRWTSVDPVGDGVVSLTGTGTDDARVAIGVPAGTDHNPWASADVPRVVQDVDDTDLAVEAKFDSIPTAFNQTHGLLFLHDPTNFTRFSVHHDGTGLRVFASSTINGSGKSRINKALPSGLSAIWLRATRTGDSWNLRWSPDGENWTNAGTFSQALTVDTMGPFAGNAAGGGSAAAAYTATIDYVFDPASPIEPEDGGGATDPSPTPTPTPTEPTPTPTPTPTPSDPPATEFASDDFSAPDLDDRWTTVDPVGGATVAPVGTGTQDARLAISLPADEYRDAGGVNTATRILQPANDTDFELEAKFDAVPTERFQDQGIIVQESSTRWLRFSTYSDGSAIQAYASSTTGTTATQVMKKKMNLSGHVYLRVSRAGDTWTFRASSNGSSWTTIGSTTQQLEVTAVGPHAGTTGPAWTALVDYFFDTAQPVSPEDGGAPPDVTPPELSLGAVQAGSRAVVVEWSTNEFATGQLEVRPQGSTAWPFQAAADTGALAQSVQVDGLQPNTAYELRGTATDLAGNSITTSIQTFTTTEVSGPQIDVWYGDAQRFGANGRPQPKVNILGNVADGDGVQSLRYSVNGAPSKALTVGPDQRRLQYQGDFNADISYTDLAAGSNAVTITATDGLGEVTTKTVTVVRQDTAPPALPFVTDWTDDTPLTDQATVVDGRWTVDDDGVRVASDSTGYDRVIALGDLSWTDYEVTVPFTVHGIGPGAGSPLSNEAMVGLGLRWPGHQTVDSKQPAWGYKTIGAYAWYRFYATPRMELLGNGATVKARKDAALTLGQPYVFKVRADTVGSTTTYSMKMYRQGEPEPADWDLSYTGTGPANGSVALIAHHTDVTFGTVTVDPL